MSLRAHIYFDESGGLDQGWLIVGGVIVLGDAVRDEMEPAWVRRGRKARKWGRPDFDQLRAFACGPTSRALACSIRLTPELRKAYAERVRTAAEMDVHTAHGSESKLREYSLLWQHLFSKFAGLCLAFLAVQRVGSTEVVFHPDDSSMPAWQRRIVQQAVQHLDGATFGRHIETCKPSHVSASELAQLLAGCTWSAPEYCVHEKASRLLDLADGVCAACHRFMRGDAEELEALAAATPDSTLPVMVEVTEMMEWRGSLGWVESAQTFVPPGFAGGTAAKS